MGIVGVLIEIKLKFLTRNFFNHFGLIFLEHSQSKNDQIL